MGSNATPTRPALDDLSDHANLAARPIAQRRGRWFGVLIGSPLAQGVVELLAAGWPIVVVGGEGNLSVRTRTGLEAR